MKYINVVSNAEEGVDKVVVIADDVVVGAFTVVTFVIALNSVDVLKSSLIVAFVFTVIKFVLEGLLSKVFVVDVEDVTIKVVLLNVEDIRLVDGV